MVISAGRASLGPTRLLPTSGRNGQPTADTQTEQVGLVSLIERERHQKNWSHFLWYAPQTIYTMCQNTTQINPVDCGTTPLPITPIKSTKRTPLNKMLLSRMDEALEALVYCFAVHSQFLNILAAVKATCTGFLSHACLKTCMYL